MTLKRAEEIKEQLTKLAENISPGDDFVIDIKVSPLTKKKE